MNLSLHENHILVDEYRYFGWKGNAAFPPVPANLQSITSIILVACSEISIQDTFSQNRAISSITNGNQPMMGNLCWIELKVTHW